MLFFGREGETSSLQIKGVMEQLCGNMEEANRCYTEAVRIQRALDIPIEQSYIDRGYCFASTMVFADSSPVRALSLLT